MNWHLTQKTISTCLMTATNEKLLLDFIFFVLSWLQYLMTGGSGGPYLQVPPLYGQAARRGCLHSEDTNYGGVKAISTPCSPVDLWGKQHFIKNQESNLEQENKKVH